MCACACMCACVHKMWLKATPHHSTYLYMCVFLNERTNRNENRSVKWRSLANQMHAYTIAHRQIKHLRLVHFLLTSFEAYSTLVFSSSAQIIGLIFYRFLLYFAFVKICSVHCVWWPRKDLSSECVCVFAVILQTPLKFPLSSGRRILHLCSLIIFN